MRQMDRGLENDLAKYVSTVRDGEYDGILAEDRRYDIFLHLSRMRCSLLNWYELKENASVLEMDGGYGALTELLCEKAGRVTTLVRTKGQAEIIGARCRRFSNLEIRAGEAEKNKKYDYILMAGVLEFLCGGKKNTSLYSEALKKVINHLSADGTILLATDNRCGLRYFCGEKDPVTGKPFAGLNRYPEGSEGYLFNRQELITILSGIPGLKYKFYYPLPDYRFAQLIYTDFCLPGPNVKERLLTPAADHGTLVMEEKRLYEDITVNGAFPFLANSFLIECNTHGTFNAAEYAAVSTDRGREHGFATIVKKDEVIKRALYPEGGRALYALENNLRDLEKRGVRVVPYKCGALQMQMPRERRPPLSEVLEKTLWTDPDRYREWFRILYQNILLSSDRGSFSRSKFRAYGLEEDKWGYILKKAYIDMIPINCFVDEQEKKLLFFDQEFAGTDIPAGYVMFRALKYTYLFIPGADQIVHLDEMKREYGLEAAWEYYVKEENAFVAENRDYKTYGGFNKWCRRDQKGIGRNIKRL